MTFAVGVGRGGGSFVEAECPLGSLVQISIRRVDI